MATRTSPAALQSLLDGRSPFALVDVREAGEYNSSHIPGASLISRRQVELALPHAFAEKLFDMTKLGMRVILTRDEIVPEDFSHPALFKPAPMVASAEPMRISRASYRAELPI